MHRISAIDDQKKSDQEKQASFFLKREGYDRKSTVMFF